MKQKIYLICSETRRPSGGVKQLFRMVDNLNQLGYDAYLVRKSRLKAIKWFSYNTPIVYFPYLYFLIKNMAIKKCNQHKLWFKIQNLLFLNKNLPEKNAIIVYPEIYGNTIHTILPDNKYVIFNQNCFLTYNLFDAFYDDSPYKSQRFLGGITVSDNSLEYLNYAYPLQDFYRVRLGISDVFNFGVNKKKQIAYMPRKLNEDSNQIIHILKERNVLKDWNIVAIDNKSEDEVSLILQESIFFLSFNHKEGLGLPPLEAMACGCYVVGYAGYGGEEYFKEEFSSLIADGDIISYAKEIELLIKNFESNPQIILNKGELASAYVKNTFTLANELSDTKCIWKSLLAKY